MRSGGDGRGKKREKKEERRRKREKVSFFILRSSFFAFPSPPQHPKFQNLILEN